MKKKIIKTITVGNKDEPTESYIDRHVDAKVFNKAHRAEGWSGDPWLAIDLLHVYYKCYKNGSVRFFYAPKQDRKPCTVGRWG